MTAHGLVDLATTFGGEFVRQVQQAATTARLFEIMESAARELGARYFAIIHHADLRLAQPGLVNVNNYPELWADGFIDDRLYAEDPVVQACLRTNAAFAWTDLPALIRLTPRHHEILAAAALRGLPSGITIPACIPGEPTGSCSFSGFGPAAELESVMPLAQFIGAFGFAAARRLASGGALAWSRRPHLTPRQRECIILVGRGKTDWEIAKILGLSRVTVKHYLDDARRLYDVPSRTQLVLLALLDGTLCYSELTPKQYVHPAG